MLKCILIAVVVGAIVPATLLAQGFPIDELRAPSIPAFALQKGSITSVPIPTTPSEFTADLQNFMSGNGLRQGYGVEATLRSIFAPNDYETFRASLEDPGFGKCVARTSAISVATGPSGIPSDTNGTGLSIGFRVQPLIGHVSDTLYKALHRYDVTKLWPTTVIAPLKVSDSRYLLKGHKYTPKDVLIASDTEIAREQLRFKAKPDFPSNSEWDTIRSAVQQIILECNIVDSTIDTIWKNALAQSEDKFLNSDTAKKLLHSLHDLSLNRYGFVCEVSAATKMDWIGSSSDAEHFDKMGAWASFGYKDEMGLNVAILARYLVYTPEIDSSNRFQLGASLGYHSDRWEITGEFLGQNISELNTSNKDSTVFANRYDLNITYSPSNLITASLTIGKDFTDTKTKINPVLAVLGFNFNWSYLSKLIAATQ